MIAEQSKPQPRQHHFWPIIILALLTFAMFGDVLLTTDQAVLSRRWLDIFRQGAYWRLFGFGQLAGGNLALWNPHVFSGKPFLGSFQSALLYPLNLIYLALPLAKAVNFSIALHVFLAGLFTYLWTRGRGLHVAACMLSAVLVMFCGAHVMHIYPGHLSMLCTMVWLPMVLLCVDRLFAGPRLKWCLLGAFTVAMQILAGHPQYVFYTAVTAAVYSALCMIKAERRPLVLGALAGMYVGGTLLAAAHLLAGVEAARESIRSGAPAFFGNMWDFPYWGRCYQWEVWPFVGVSGFILAAYGALNGPRSVRRFSLSMAGILLVLALGANTPLFKILYTCVPGFDRFRCNARFAFPFSVFLAMLAAVGIDQLLRRPRWHMKTAATVLAVGVLLFLAAAWVHGSANSGSGSAWQRILQASSQAAESKMPRNAPADETFVRQSGAFAARSLAVSGVICLVLAALFYLTKFSHKVAYVMALVAGAEVFVLATVARPTFDLNAIPLKPLARFYAAHPGDYRVSLPLQGNVAMAVGWSDIWGYDPVIMKRYAEFMIYTQGHDPNDATYDIVAVRPHKLHRLLRCRYFFQTSPAGLRPIEVKDVLPRVLLIQDYRVIKDRDRIFAAMDDPSFDPRKTVILESEPDPTPRQTETIGSAAVIESGTDHLDIEADLAGPAILLITDAYSKGWHAKPLPGSVQKQYTVMPADYVLRAVPLAKGHHRLRVEYLPTGFRIGKWISILSLIAYLGLVSLELYGAARKSTRTRRSSPP